MEQPFLEIKDLRVAYGPRAEVLHGLNISIANGETVAVLGANGAGKTTLIKAINGLVRPVKGEIKFQESNIANTPAHRIARSGIATVPEGRRIFPQLTVRENLLMGAYYHYARRSKSHIIEEILTWLMELFPKLGSRHNQLAGTLSGGEQQMLAIGRALMNQPKLLLLDEPSMGIAPILVETIFEALKKISQKGISMMIVEQNANIALTLANRGYVLETGRITLSGISSELVANEAVIHAYLGGPGK